MSPLKCFCHLVLALGFAPVILYIDLERSDGTILVSIHLFSIFQKIPETSFRAKAITGVRTSFPISDIIWFHPQKAPQASQWCQAV